MSLLPLSMALKSPLKVKMALGRWGRGREESSDGAETPGSDPGSDPGFDADWLCPHLSALVCSPGHLEQTTSKAP